MWLFGGDAGSRAWKIKGYVICCSSKNDLHIIYIYMCVHTLVHSDLMYANMYDVLGCRLIGSPLKQPCGVTSTVVLMTQLSSCKLIYDIH